jgi:hypothetical protein
MTATTAESSRKELVTKGDLHDVKHEILKWMMGMFVAQAALFFGTVAFFLK